MPTQYLLDPAWHAEQDRLNSLTQLYDPATMTLIERLDLPVARAIDGVIDVEGEFTYAIVDTSVPRP